MLSDEQRRRMEEIRARTVARPLWEEGDEGDAEMPQSAAGNDSGDFSYEYDVLPSEAGEMPRELTDGQKRAVSSAMNILSFADNSERRLREKLTRKGYSPDEVGAAIAYVVEKGYLREDRMLANAARYLAERKLFGRARICVELIKKGFTRDNVTSVELGDYDFTALCARRIRATEHIGDEPVPDFSLSDKQKAALIRAGFSYGEITAAASLIRDGSDSGCDE